MSEKDKDGRIDLWFLFYGIFVAFLIQVLYDQLGKYRFPIGIAIAATGLIILWIVIYVNPPKRRESEQIKLLKEISEKLDKISDSIENKSGS